MAKKNIGKDFEHRFAEASKKQGIYTHRLKDTDLSYNGNSVSSYTPKNKCDFYLFKSFKGHLGCLFGIECKSTKYPSIGIQPTEEDPKKMIMAHQLESLRDLSKNNIYAGFVLNFRDEDLNEESTYYLSIEKMDEFLLETHKKSINETDCRMRALPMDSILKRTKYTYDVDKMITDIIREDVNKKDF